MMPLEKIIEKIRAVLDRDPLLVYDRDDDGTPHIFGDVTSSVSFKIAYKENRATLKKCDTKKLGKIQRKIDYSLWMRLNNYLSPCTVVLAVRDELRFRKEAGQ